MVRVYVQVKEKESFDRTIKRFKKKVDQIKLIKMVKARRYFEKPSKLRMIEKKKSYYRQRYRNKDN